MNRLKSFRSLFDIHQKKVMLYVWRNFKGKDFCYQPDKPNNAFRIERPELIDRKGFVCHQDKPRSHTSFVIRQKLLKLEWDTMPHLLYISDPTPLDYYLFRTIQNFQAVKEKVKNHHNQLFASKDQTFHQGGIMLLPDRWQILLNHNSHYRIK